MKRILVVLITLISISLPAYADNVEDRFVSAYVEGIKKYETQIDLSEFENEITNEDIHRIMERPDTQVAGIVTPKRIITRDNGLVIKVEYASTKEQQKALDKFVKMWVNKNIDPTMDDALKVRLITQYIINNYDYKGIDGNITDSVADDRFDTAAMLNKGCGVCNSFAGLFRELATEAGVEVIDVIGQAKFPNGKIESHAWNAAKIDSKWYCVDISFENHRPGGFILYGTKTRPHKQFVHMWDESLYPDFSEIGLAQARRNK